jgi:hypothetical protein
MQRFGWNLTGVSSPHQPFATWRDANIYTLPVESAACNSKRTKPG